MERSGTKNLGLTRILRCFTAFSMTRKYTFQTTSKVQNNFLQRYTVQTGGSSQHQEYWIPAEDLDNFNAHIVGKIEVIAEFRD